MTFLSFTLKNIKIKKTVTQQCHNSYCNNILTVYSKSLPQSLLSIGYTLSSLVLVSSKLRFRTLQNLHRFVSSLTGVNGIYKM